MKILSLCIMLLGARQTQASDDHKISKETAQALMDAIKDKDHQAFQQAIVPLKYAQKEARENFFKTIMPRNFLFDAIRDLPSAALGFIRLGAPTNTRCHEWRDYPYQTSSGLKTLEVAAQFKKNKVLRRLLKQDPAPRPLHSSLYFANMPSTLKILFRAGAQIFTWSWYGENPLHRAASREMVKVLVAAGALVNEQDRNGNTPLHRARSLEVVQALLAAGAKVNIRNYENKTPFDYNTRNHKIASLLLTEEQISAVDINGDTFLHRAARDGKTILVKACLLYADHQAPS